MDPPARKTLALIVRHIICGHLAPDQELTAAQKRDYSFAIRTLLVATSATLARSTAGAI